MRKILNLNILFTQTPLSQIFFAGSNATPQIALFAKQIESTEAVR